MRQGWLFAASAAAVFSLCGCAFTRPAECQRSRDVSAHLAARVHGLGAEVSLDTKRTVTAEYDGLLASYDLLCENQDHLTGPEYACEVRRHAEAMRALGNFLTDLRTCSDHCPPTMLEEYQQSRRTVAQRDCLEATDASRSAEVTPSGGAIPVAGTPHGEAVVGFVGGFVTPLGHALDVGGAYGWNSTNEIGISYLTGTNDLNDQAKGPITDFKAGRLRYTHYFSDSGTVKPFVRGSLFTYSTRDDDCIDPAYTTNLSRCPSSRSTDVSVTGVAAEGGLLIDFARWVGLYGEAIIGVGSGTTSAGGQARWTIVGGGAGLQLRLVD